MNNSDISKKYKTYIKSAQGMVGMILVLNLIYILKVIISKNFDFWFSTYLTEYMMKASGFLGIYSSDVSKALAVAAIITQIAALALATGLSQKNGKLLYVCLALYGIDTVFLLIGDITNRLGDFCEASYIDIIVHFFVIAFIINGIYGYEKLKKLKIDQQQEPQEAE